MFVVWVRGLLVDYDLGKETKDTVGWSSWWMDDGWLVECGAALRKHKSSKGWRKISDNYFLFGNEFPLNERNETPCHATAYKLDLSWFISFVPYCILSDDIDKIFKQSELIYQKYVTHFHNSSFILFVDKNWKGAIFFLFCLSFDGQVLFYLFRFKFK